MVILFNLLPLLLFVGFVFLAYKLKKWWFVLVGFMAVAFYFQIQPSYIPKGEVRRTELPEFEQSSKEIVNRMSKPKSGDEYDKERQQQIDDIENKIKSWNQPNKTE